MFLQEAGRQVVVDRVRDDHGLVEELRAVEGRVEQEVADERALARADRRADDGDLHVAMHCFLSNESAKTMCSLPLVHANLLLTTSSKNEPGVFQMSATQGEPAGYMSAKQVAGGMVHLISSRNHYGFVSPHALCRCLWFGSFLTAVVIAEPRVATQAAGCMTVMCVA